MTDFIAFDLEITEIVDFAGDLNPESRLGISCAATLVSDGELKLWHGREADGGYAARIEEWEAWEMATWLHEQQAAGVPIVTWNGLGFDFHVLAVESGDFETCGRLAEGHVDLMFAFHAVKGFPHEPEKGGGRLRFSQGCRWHREWRGRSEAMASGAIQRCLGLRVAGCAGHRRRSSLPPGAWGLHLDQQQRAAQPLLLASAGTARGTDCHDGGEGTSLASARHVGDGRSYLQGGFPEMAHGELIDELMPAHMRERETFIEHFGLEDLYRLRPCWFNKV